MLTTQYAKAFPEAGGEAIVRLALHGGDGSTGTFSDRHGALPW